VTSKNLSIISAAAGAAASLLLLPLQLVAPSLESRSTNKTRVYLIFLNSMEK